MNSRLHGHVIKQGSDTGHVNVLRRYAGNGHEKFSYDMTFGFVLEGIHHEGEFHENK
jgi:hypothetical protein